MVTVTQKQKDAIQKLQSKFFTDADTDSPKPKWKTILLYIVEFAKLIVEILPIIINVRKVS